MRRCFPRWALAAALHCLFSPVLHCTENGIVMHSVADPDVNPGSWIQFITSQIQGQKDSRIRIRIGIKEFKYFNPKNCFQALGNMIRDVHPGFGSQIRILIFYPSRIQGSKRQRKYKHWKYKHGSRSQCLQWTRFRSKSSVWEGTVQDNGFFEKKTLEFNVMT
jgi:hypothetical protein